MEKGSAGPATAAPETSAGETTPARRGRAGRRTLIETPALTWIDLDDPQSAELDEVAARYGFHELAVEDCRNVSQLAKLEPFPHHVFLIANTIRFDGATNELHVREIDIFVGERFVVTVHNGQSLAVEAVAGRLAGDPHLASPARVLHMLLDAMVDRFLPTLDKIGETIDDVEEGILEQMDPACLPKTFQLKRNLVHFRRAAVAQRELLNTLWRHESGIVPKDLAPYFRDVYDHVVTAIEMIESYRDLISGLLEIYLTQTANRTNQIVKAITIIATIILPLTLITGWYGMNVVNLPFAEDPFGLWYITAGLVLVILGFLAFFRHKGWL